MIRFFRRTSSRQWCLPLILWILFTFFIIYGTTIPFSFNFDEKKIFEKLWNVSWVPFIDPDGSRVSLSDVVQNILLFIPFGFLGYFSLKIHSKKKLTIIVFSGFILSFLVEIVQLFTLDRTTSITDVVTNTFGAVLGFCCANCTKNITIYLWQSCSFHKYTHNRYFYALLVSCVVVILGALHPFDFSLDVGSVGAKVRYIINNPMSFNLLLHDEAIVFLRYLLFSFIWNLYLLEEGGKSSCLVGIAIGCFVGLSLETSQFFISSRMPSIQDALVMICGILVGAVFASVRSSLLNNIYWSLIIIMATGVSAAVFSMSPFQLTHKIAQMNWIPFLPHYQKTSFNILSNFFQSMLIYFPMGFVVQSLFNKKNTYLILIFTTFLFSFSLEYSQQWILGRYPDITDVVGSIIGTLSGVLICHPGGAIFREYIDNPSRSIE